MPDQLTLTLRPCRVPRDVLRFDAGFPLNWRALDRRAMQLVKSLASQSMNASLREGFALRRYAGDAALLEALRARATGKQLKQAARKAGHRLPVKAAVLLAVTPEGRRLHALVDHVEERVAAWEAGLCG